MRRGDAGLRSLWGWDREPGCIYSRTLPSTCPAAGSPGPGRDRSLIGGRGLLFSVLLSQTNTSEVTHRNGYSLPSFFLPRGLVSWGAACREAVGSKDRNNILRLAVSYRVKTTPSSRQLDPLWPSSKSPKRGLPSNCKSRQHPCPRPYVTWRVSPTSPRRLPAGLRLTCSYPLHQ